MLPTAVPQGDQIDDNEAEDPFEQIKTNILGLQTDVSESKDWVDLLRTAVSELADGYEAGIVTPIIDTISDRFTEWLISAYKPIRNTVLTESVAFYNRVVAAINSGGAIWQ